ncbi:MAG: DUF4440 domain-containing protein [Actinobacteria bacterium]|nr:DUF4440 domain-containing protein [Actinomycetota bacterium]
MKRYIFLLLAVLIFTQCSQTNRSSDRRQIEQLVRKFNKAFDEKDFAAIGGMMTSDARWYTLNGRVLRVMEIKPFFLPMMSRWHSMETKIKDIEIKTDGKLAVVRYKSRFEFTSHAGKNKMDNLQTIVFVRQNKKWKIWQIQMSTK